MSSTLTPTTKTEEQQCAPWEDPSYHYFDAVDARESDRMEWWKPRVEGVARHIVENLSSSDIILLQEWWFRKEFTELFDSITSPLFHRVAERRPGRTTISTSNNKSSNIRKQREDGMAVLLRKDGPLELLGSEKITTGPQRIAQLVRCREKRTNRSIHVANVHLSFPGGNGLLKDERKQAYEAQVIARALSFYRPGGRKGGRKKGSPLLEIIGGDFNSNSRALASHKLESHPHRFVNCASASAQQSLTSGSGGSVALGVTHRNHRGEEVSVDHVFARLTNIEEQQQQQQWKNNNNKNPSTDSAGLRLGYLDSYGTRVVDCCRGNLELMGRSVISDHRPVTATIEWPYHRSLSGGERDTSSFGLDEYAPLDPLEPPSWWK